MGHIVVTMNNTTAIQAEKQDTEMLRKAEKALDYARQKESESRAALQSAMETTKMLKEKKERLFFECEKRAVARRKSGLIEINAGY